MATIKTDLICNLNQPVNVTYLHGNLFSQDNAGNTINVFVMDNGEPATIGGTVSANVIRSDGQTVAVSGAIEGNKAYVILPQACYAVPGVVHIIIKLTQNTTITTIAAIVANVYMSTTDAVIDPGTVIPSIQALMALIEEAVDSIPTDYTGLLHTIAADYSSSKTYKVGDYAWESGVLKRCIVPITAAETYTAAHWTNAVIGDDLTNLKSALNFYVKESEKDFTGETIYNTLINSSTNKWSTSNNYQSYIFAVPEGARSLEIISNSTNGTPFAFLRSNSHTHGTLADYAGGTGRTFIPAGETIEYEVPADCKYIWILKDVSGTSYMPTSVMIGAFEPIPQIDKTLTEEGAAADAKVVGENLEKIDEIVEGGTVDVDVDLISGLFYANGSNVVGGDSFLSSSPNGKYGIIDVSYAKGGSVTIVTETLTASDTTMTLICDEDHKIIRKVATSNILVLSDGVYSGRLAIPENAKYLQYSVYKGSASIIVKQRHRPLADIGLTMYVTTSGSDDNDGLTLAKAKATVSAALNAGARNVLVSGGKYFEAIDFSGVKGAIKIAPAEYDGLPVFYAPNSLITEEETAVSGYTKVYSAPCAKEFDSKIVWIFQDGVPDPSTEITTEDRHPLSRGKQYRCEDTKIVKCSANNVSDALTEIENATGYKWYFDSANSVIYFSRPQSVTSANPIMTSFGSTFFNNENRGLNLELIGLCAKYMYFGLQQTLGAVVSDCECHNAMSEAGFRWNSGTGIKLYRCEASRIFYSTTSGDGFNAHSPNTGDVFAHQTTCMLFDCWGHDCCDDGYSDHERCEISIYGGLFENNGGGGVVPAQGSHCTCYNVLSRYNGEADFFYTGNPSAAEGGAGGQIACFNCVSVGHGTGRGFRLNGSNVQGLFVNCVCINRLTGFYSENNGGTQVGTLINCSTVDCTTQKSSIYTVKNGTPVT